MLGKLVQREADDLPVLTLSGGDEKSALGTAHNKRSQVREDGTKDAFHGGRDLNKYRYLLSFSDFQEVLSELIM